MVLDALRLQDPTQTNVVMMMSVAGGRWKVGGGRPRSGPGEPLDHGRKSTVNQFGLGTTLEVGAEGNNGFV